MNHYDLLHTKYKSNCLHGFRRFFKKFSPNKRKLMTDPQGMVKLDPKGKFGTIYAGNHKTLLETKYINYGPHRKDF